MIARTALQTIVCLALGAGWSAAQPAPTEPPPLWEAQVGASFVGTSGNSDTTTAGADFELHRRWPVWQLESTGTAVRATSEGVRTAERYLGTLRGERHLTSLLSLSTGERAERDRFAGIDFRSILDAGLGWALVRASRWSLDGTTGIAWNHEQPIAGADRDHPVGVLQALSRISLGAAGDTTERFTFYPDFDQPSAYRSEAEVTAQAAMNSHLALKLGYLWRYSNAPIGNFKKTDTTTTASIVLHWRTPAR
jgi:putative salt-induced outer membrane protein